MAGAARGGRQRGVKSLIVLKPLERHSRNQEAAQRCVESFSLFDCRGNNLRKLDFHFAFVETTDTEVADVGGLFAAAHVTRLSMHFHFNKIAIGSGMRW